MCVYPHVPFVAINSIITKSINFVVLFNFSFANYSSDCEQNDLVEVAKDEQMADKLYTETLRVLKLERI